MRVGYARVSSTEQDTALQIDSLAKAGVGQIYQEKRSARMRRPELERMLDSLRPGDVVVVYKFDRFARSLPDLLRIVDRIRSARASFISLTESVDTGTAYGEMVMHILASVAQFELSMIRERCQAGRDAALSRGVRFGRPQTIDTQRIAQLMADGYHNAQIARMVGCHPSSVGRVVRKLTVTQ